jgi:Glyoxalase/Bleomycin resistance protein/Dioxygenase superfamily
MLEGRVYQNAYVTRDIDKAVADFAARADARSTVQFEATSDVLTSAGPGSQTVKLAFTWVGDFQYEFIQPVREAVPLFGGWLPDDDTPRFHHSCARVDDWDSFRRRVARGPYPVVTEGAGEGGLKFLFLDTRALLGHYLEYTFMGDAAWRRLGGR